MQLSWPYFFTLIKYFHIMLLSKYVVFKSIIHLPHDYLNRIFYRQLYMTARLYPQHQSPRKLY